MKYYGSFTVMNQNKEFLFFEKIPNTIRMFTVFRPARMWLSTTREF